MTTYYIRSKERKRVKMTIPEIRKPKEMIMSAIAVGVIGVYCYLAYCKEIDVQDLKEIVLMVISYYYGSKSGQGAA